MTKILKFSAIALLAILMVAPAVSAQRFGGGFRGGFHGGFRGGIGFYGPGWWGYGWGPYWGPYGYYYSPGSAAGEVKIETPAKDALVYVDGGYAGLSGKLRHFHLSPGSHQIELRDPSGHIFYQETINVLPGKTIEIGRK
jgi:hypothetical protein